MSFGIIEKALSCLGKGFDITSDFRLKYCKGDGRLVVLNETETGKLDVPGFGIVDKVSVDIKCDRGERIRYQSDVLEFNQMSELFNRRNSLPGKIPSGLFNAMYGFESSSWAKDASSTKCLAFDGYYISFFNLLINRSPLRVLDEVRNAVPAVWDPVSLARFIENYGTHIIVAISVGGQDVVLVKQDHRSNLPASDLKQHLNDLGDQLFTGTCAVNPSQSKKERLKAPEAFNIFDPQPKIINTFSSVKTKNGITVISTKRGGDASIDSHSEWLQTVPSAPDAIHFSLVPITSLLKDVPGGGFLFHAINLYQRYKPPIADLQYFLDFQSHKLWAPINNDHPLGPITNRASLAPALYFNLMGPKLFVNTTQVMVGRTPVTGMRLYLEGKKCDRLAMHLQHLSSTPVLLQNRIEEVSTWKGTDDAVDSRYLEPVQRKMCSHICTTPIEYEPKQANGEGLAYIVTGAQFQVEKRDSKSILHLRLLFSRVSGAYIGQSTWAESSMSTDCLQKSSFLSAISTSILGSYPEKDKIKQMVIDSGVFPTDAPLPVQAVKLLRFVDMSQITKGPQDSPGYWVVTGAKLEVEMGKICIHVKFSLLYFS